MILKQYYLGCLAHASYMIADEKTKVAAIVDPQRDIDEYVADAEAAGWTIRHVFLTHFHADFIAGHIELQQRTGAQIYLGSKAQAEYEFMALKEGDVVEFGDVRLKILETPGHTPEGISILVFDLGRSDSIPYAVMTGDTLFIGDVGRPDLLASIGVTEDELANLLYDSLNEKLRPLPDETLVYPAHGAGSMCGKNLSDETVSTIGEQKKYNYAFQPMSREEFVALVTEGQPEAPDYFVFDAIKNREARPSLDDTLKQALRPLTLDELLRLQREEQAQILDVRNAIDFEAAFLPGSINVGLDGKYATWCGSLLDHTAPIVVIADTDRQEEAIMRLGRIGFDNVVGYLEGGAGALEAVDDRLQKTDRITAVALHEMLSTDDAPVVIDVRTPTERAGGYVEGSLHMPLNHLRESAAKLPQDKTLVVHCAGGYRSAIAASILRQQGIDQILDMVGGFQAWEKSQLPVIHDDAQTATAS